MTDDTRNAPDPDDNEFLEEQDTVERQAPGTDADTPATEPGLLPDDPPLVGEDTTTSAERGND